MGTERIGARVGARDPPSGSWVTSTCLTPSRLPGTATAADPSVLTPNSAGVGSGALRAGPQQPHLVDAAARRRRQVAADEHAAPVAVDLERHARVRRGRAVHLRGDRPGALVPAAGHQRAADAAGEQQQRRERRGRRGARQQAAQPAAAARRRGGDRGTVGALPGGREQLGIGLDDRHDAGLQRRGRGHGRRRGGQRVGGDAQLGELAPARRARLQMMLEARDLVVGERSQQVGGGRVGPVVVVGCAHGATSFAPRRSRILCSPSRILPFTVPTGVSSMSAISVCVNPPK